MSKYFKDEYAWSENNKNSLGLPRPYAITDPKFYKFFDKFYLHKKIPIPWQSVPRMKDRPIDLFVENENLVYKESRCAYCGMIFNNDEYCIRWISQDRTPTQIGPRVFSDSHPFHIECMKQARIFCPHMRKTNDNEFEHGLYKDLKINAEKYKESLSYKNIENQSDLLIFDDFIEKEDCLILVDYIEKFINTKNQNLSFFINKYLNKIKSIINNQELYLADFEVCKNESGFMRSVHTDIESGKEHFNLSFILYISTDVVGGEIVFPDLKVKHSPKNGQAILFESGSKNSIHGIEIIQSGTRYEIPIWITYDKNKELVL
jgi:hypothetical protein